MAREGGNSLNIFRYSDETQRLLMGHVFPGGRINAHDIAAFRSQCSEEFRAQCMATKEEAMERLLQGKKYGCIYAGTTLVVAKRDYPLPWITFLDLPVFGPSRGQFLEHMTTEELLSHSKLHAAGKFINYNAVTSGYLARALLVESNLFSKGEFVSNPQRNEGVAIDRTRKLLLVVEPNEGMGYGLSLYLDESVATQEPNAAVVMKGMPVTTFCGQKTPVDKTRHDPYAIHSWRNPELECSTGYGAKFCSSGFMANHTCNRDALFIAQDRFYKRQGSSK